MKLGIVGFQQQKQYKLGKGDQPTAPKGTKKIGTDAPTFFKALGKAIAKPFKALGQTAAKTGQQTTANTGGQTAAGEVRNPRVQQALDTFIALRKADTSGTSKTDTGGAQKTSGATKGDSVKKSDTPEAIALAAARKELVAAMREELRSSPLYKAAEDAPDDAYCTEKVFEGTTPRDALDEAIGNKLMSPGVLEKFRDSGLSVAEGAAIFTYTRGAYVAINAEVRRGPSNESDLMRETRVAIENGLNKLPPYQDQHGTASPAIYRLAKLPDNVDANYKQGKIVSDPGIMSTTSKDQFNFKGMDEQTHCLTIKLKPDTKARDVHWLAETPNEFEVLLPPGTQMKVLFRDMDGMPPPKDKRTQDEMVGVVMVEI